MSAILMLRHIDLSGHADRVERALLATFQAGIKTPDIGGTAGTKAFTKAVVERLAVVHLHFRDHQGAHRTVPVHLRLAAEPPPVAHVVGVLLRVDGERPSPPTTTSTRQVEQVPLPPQT